METDCCYLSYRETGFFSALLHDYVSGHGKLQPFYSYPPDAGGIQEAITARKRYPVNRDMLTSTLNRQYAALSTTEAVRSNLAALKQAHTFTVCTAHQPNLATGYLYFIYKIIHTIKLAAELNSRHPHYRFVPVYYMGSEDNDLEELGTFRYGHETFRWDARGQKGAVGRMNTQSLRPLMDKLFSLLGPPGENEKKLKQVLTDAYLRHATVADATLYLVNELFGEYGLIVLNPDTAEFKKAVMPVIRDDLRQHTAYTIVSDTIKQLGQHYRVQAHPREINLFYLKDGLRERIEKDGHGYRVVDTDLHFTDTAIMEEADAHPERFSPNVILRGLLQESILPDIAFIGGGAEVAYWMQLKRVFEHYGVFYPVIIPRQSVLWIGKTSAELMRRFSFTYKDLFKNEETLYRQYIKQNNTGGEDITAETRQLETVLNRLQQKAREKDVTLEASAAATLAKIKRQLAILEHKMYKADKRKQETALRRIKKLKQDLFPGNSLQERTENFMPFYLQYGTGWLDTVYHHLQPLANSFLIIEERN